MTPIERKLAFLRKKMGRIPDVSRSELIALLDAAQIADEAAQGDCCLRRHIGTENDPRYCQCFMHRAKRVVNALAEVPDV